MSETEALARRDDEHLMGDESFEAPSTRGITSADELPRDERGRVIGVWHTVSGPIEALADHVVGGPAPQLEGASVERAIALGCAVLPGPYTGPIMRLLDDEEPQLADAAETTLPSVRLDRAELLTWSKVDLDRWAEETLGLKLDRRWTIERMVDAVLADERVAGATSDE